MDSFLYVLAVEVNRGLCVGEGTAGVDLISDECCDKGEYLTGYPGRPIRQGTAGGSVTSTKRAGVIMY